MNNPTTPLTSPLHFLFFAFRSLTASHPPPTIMWGIQNLSSVSSAGDVWRPGHRGVKVGNMLTLHIICLSDWQKLLTFVAVGRYFLFSSTYFPVRQIFFFMEWLKVVVVLMQRRHSQKWKIFKTRMVQREIQFLILRVIDSLSRSHPYFWSILVSLASSLYNLYQKDRIFADGSGPCFISGQITS